MSNPAHARFLIVDDNGESRMLLTKSLMRKFPTAAVIECQESSTAVTILAREVVNAVIAHRTFDHAGPQLVAVLRKASQSVPIVAVSGHDHADSARAAGADAFLNHDEWLQIGTVVADAIMRRAKAAGVPPPKTIRITPGTPGDSTPDRGPRGKK